MESSTVPCTQQALNKHFGSGGDAAACSLTLHRWRSGLASAEEYPEEYLDSSSPSLGEEEDNQFRGQLCSTAANGDEDMQGGLKGL